MINFRNKVEFDLREENSRCECLALYSLNKCQWQDWGLHGGNSCFPNVPRKLRRKEEEWLGLSKAGRHGEELSGPCPHLSWVIYTPLF